MHAYMRAQHKSSDLLAAVCVADGCLRSVLLVVVECECSWSLQGSMHEVSPFRSPGDELLQLAWSIDWHACVWCVITNICGPLHTC